MMVLFPRLAAAIALTLFVLPAEAQTAETTTPPAPNVDAACTYGDREKFEEISFLFDGVWKISHHSGYATAGGMVIPYGSANDNETVTITAINPDHLILDHPMAQNTVDLHWADEPNWVFEGRPGENGLDPVPAPLLSSADVELLMGCPNKDMARLIGTSFAIVDGVQMSFTYRLMIADTENMFGIMHVYGFTQGIRFDSWRSVSLAR